MVTVTREAAPVASPLPRPTARDDRPGWQLILPAAFVPLWVGFALLPDTHVAVRAPAVAILALLAGIGAELGAWAPEAGRTRSWSGTLWVVPAGVVVSVVMWLSAVSDRSTALAPAAAVGVVGLMALQRLEGAGPRGLRAAAHAINIASAFALAFVAYVLAAVWGGAWGVAVAAIATGPAALVVLRGVDARRGMIFALGGLAVLVLAELAAVMLVAGSRPPVATSAGLLLGLYVVTSVSHALLERAPRRAYLEVAVVAVIAGAFIAVAIARW